MKKKKTQLTLSNKKPEPIWTARIGQCLAAGYNFSEIHRKRALECLGARYIHLNVEPVVIPFRA